MCIRDRHHSAADKTTLLVFNSEKIKFVSVKPPVLFLLRVAINILCFFFHPKANETLKVAYLNDIMSNKMAALKPILQSHFQSGSQG